MMQPALEKAKKEYSGKADLLRINADDHPQLIRALKVFGIPTIIGYSRGSVVIRKTGAQSPDQLNSIFQMTVEGRPAKAGPAPLNRILRFASGLVLIALVWLLHGSVLFGLLGGGLVFSAVYDRCPIYRAIAPRIKALFSSAE
jgi:thioredoxin 1